jgi:hypothetical protein
MSTPTSQICPAGFHCAQGTSTPIEPCPQGHYCPQGLGPFPCPAGTYCPTGQSIPIPCPAGYYCSVRASDKILCKQGTYCPAGSSIQIPCPSYLYSLPGRAVCSCIAPPNAVSAAMSNGKCNVTCKSDYINFLGRCYASHIIPQKGLCPPCYSLAPGLCTFAPACKPTCPPGYHVNSNAVCSPQFSPVI